MENVRIATRHLPKLCGADVELGNFILGMTHPNGTSDEASRALLREIRGLPQAQSGWYSGWSCGGGREWDRYDDGRRGCDAGYGSSGSRASYNPQDWGRKFLPENGGCAYIDLNHLEICLPEVISAWDHVAAWHAMLRIVREALRAAGEMQPAGRRLQVLVNNSDGFGNSYGSHLDFLVTRRAWDNIFLRRMHYLMYLATYQVSSIVFTGQGKVGSENGAPPVRFQLSQRADFLETLVGLQTTFRRPIVNSRDEALCGKGLHNAEKDCARLHVIFHDSTLAHVSSLLKVGVFQIILAMIEAEEVDPTLTLEDPVEAVTRFSHDPDLQAKARLALGGEASALDLQFRFFEHASSFVAGGRCEGIVPRADEILALWGDTLRKLESLDFAGLAPRLDWVLKKQALERAIAQHPGLGWDSPVIKHLDLLYSSLDEREGLYWAFERGGLVERAVTDEHIHMLTGNPPEDTRAWTRAMLMRYAHADEVEDVDWDSIRFRIKGRDYWPTYRSLDLANPMQFTRAEVAPLFERALDLRGLLDALEEWSRGSPIRTSVIVSNQDPRDSAGGTRFLIQ